MSKRLAEQPAETAGTLLTSDHPAATASDHPASTASEARTTPATPAAEGNRRRPMRWYGEVVAIAIFYWLYSLTRDLDGAGHALARRAMANAYRVVGWERALGIFDEQRVQAALLPDRTLITLLNDFYASAHFLAVAGVLLYLFVRQPERYRRCRNALAITTALALIGFAAFPLAPPRLLPASFHFVDTLRVVGGLWNFSSGPVNAISNQYAAMPSLHTAWSTWTVLALMGSIRRRWVKVALFAYPATTLICVVVTANHYFLDAAGGLVVLAAGWVLSVPLTRFLANHDWRRAFLIPAAALRRAATTPPPGPSRRTQFRSGHPMRDR